ncbi:MAG: Crp/Fnr family transcriptional regulator [Rhodoferax sp.]|uniref:Crp/Fnr family transcriptional regulator n=1 Tax=Rhodoferax sp. TaxID=50421 RepID=UPI00271B3C27|nr:Crp/Fnr family transcriptional regulator [Rhodoferax sp.]MDO8447472.1 Crp/Fnr family transcriptional regulator [Rhodoferax sp.]
MDVEQFDTPRYLSVLPLFSDLSQQERERLALSCQLRRLARGDMVFRVGEECDAFYVVVVGQVKLYVASPTGQEKVIELVGPGQSFAEAMMFLSMPCILNAQALAETLLLRVTKQAVFGEIERDPRFSMHMLAGISRRLHGLVRDVEGYALHSGMQRLIGYLLRDLQDEDTLKSGVITVSLPVSKATIASRLSLTPEYFSRVLHELEAENLIEIDKREIRILDVQRLASYGSH